MRKNVMRAIWVLAITVGVIGLASGQIPFEGEKKIERDEVPAKVQAAVEKDYPNLKSGSWYVKYQEELGKYGRKSVFTPEYYEYRGKNEDVKFELDYDVNGNLQRAKGLQKADTVDSVE